MYEFMHICSLYVYKFFVYKYLYTRILLCDVCEFLQDDEDLYMQCNCDNDDDDSTGVNSEYIVRCAVGAECVDSLFNYTQAFVDSTFRQVARPIDKPDMYYSGYKEYHAMKWQFITASDGMIISAYGPCGAREGGPTIYRESKIWNIISPISYMPSVLFTNCHTCLYGAGASNRFGVIPPTLEEYLTML